MKEVGKKELWDFVKDKNLVYFSTGDYPYIGVWKDRGGNVVGKEIPEGKHIGTSKDKYRYYII